MAKSRLREAREEKGLTLRDVAEQTGLTKSQLARWEIGKGVGPLSAFIAMAEVLGVQVEQLLHVKKRSGIEPLQAIRIARNFSADKLAEAIELPPHLCHYIRRWQRGDNVEKIRKLIRLARFFNGTVADLFDHADYTGRSPRSSDSWIIVLNQTEHSILDIHQSTGIPLHTLRNWSEGEIHSTITDALALCEKLGYRLESLFNKGGTHFALQLRSICQDADITESELCHKRLSYDRVQRWKRGLGFSQIEYAIKLAIFAKASVATLFNDPQGLTMARLRENDMRRNRERLAKQAKLLPPAKP